MRWRWIHGHAPRLQIQQGRRALPVYRHRLRLVRGNDIRDVTMPILTPFVTSLCQYWHHNVIIGIIRDVSMFLLTQFVMSVCQYWRHTWRHNVIIDIIRDVTMPILTPFVTSLCQYWRHSWHHCVNIDVIISLATSFVMSVRQCWRHRVIIEIITSFLMPLHNSYDAIYVHQRGTPIRRVAEGIMDKCIAYECSTSNVVSYYVGYVVHSVYIIVDVMYYCCDRYIICIYIYIALNIMSYGVR